MAILSQSQPTGLLLLAVATVFCLSLSLRGVDSFSSYYSNVLQQQRAVAAASHSLSGASSTVQDDIQIRWEDDENDDDDEDDDEEQPKAKGNRWEKLDPKYKQYLIKKGQERALKNKQKREPTMDKKRKVLMFMKDQQRKKKKGAKVHRPLSIKDRTRTPLADMPVGAEREGTVISLTPFGAYVDVGTECDGLLHVSQISQDVFVEHPRQVLTPGDTVTVRVRSTNPDRQKLHLTMLPPEILEEEQEELATFADRIPLEDIQVDDELWGQIKRVTDFGAYVEVGAIVDGWLHFMDHPRWDGGMVPSDFMARSDRVRVWVSDVDREQKRLKLTAHRPTHLPGPRREF